MSPQPELIFSMDFAFPAIITIAIALVVFIAVKFKPGALLIFAGVCLVGFIFLTILSMSYVSLQVKPSPNVTQQATAAPVAAPDTIADASQIPLPTLPLVARKPHETQAPAHKASYGQQAATTEPLPEWAQKGEQASADSKLVFQSGLFITRAEALQDALGKASEKLEQTLQLEHPQYPKATQQISPEEIRRVALRRSYYQTVEHDFGDVLKSGKPLKQDMYRAYVEVENSPSVQQVFYTKWKLQTGNQRVVWLGGAFGMITLLCIGVTVYLRAARP